MCASYLLWLFFCFFRTNFFALGPTSHYRGLSNLTSVSVRMKKKRLAEENASILWWTAFAHFGTSFTWQKRSKLRCVIAFCWRECTYKVMARIRCAHLCYLHGWWRMSNLCVFHTLRLCDVWMSPEFLLDNLCVSHTFFVCVLCVSHTFFFLSVLSTRQDMDCCNALIIHFQLECAQVCWWL